MKRILFLSALAACLLMGCHSRSDSAHEEPLPEPEEVSPQTWSPIFVYCIAVPEDGRGRFILDLNQKSGHYSVTGYNSTGGTFKQKGNGTIQFNPSHLWTQKAAVSEEAREAEHFVCHLASAIAKANRYTRDDFSLVLLHNGDTTAIFRLIVHEPEEGRELTSMIDIQEPRVDGHAITMVLSDSNFRTDCYDTYYGVCETSNAT